MITEKVVFETEDGKQFIRKDEAEEWEKRLKLKNFLAENCWDRYDGWDIDCVIDKLFEHYELREKEKDEE